MPISAAQQRDSVIHIYTFLFSYSLPSWSIPRDWTEFPVLDTRTSCPIHPQCRSLNLLTPKSPVSTSSKAPWVCVCQDHTGGRCYLYRDTWKRPDDEPICKDGGRAQEDGESGEGTPGSMVGGGGGGVSISDWRQEVWVGFLWLEREPSVMLPCEANHGGQAPRAASRQVTPTTEQNREGGDGSAGLVSSTWTPSPPCSCFVSSC